MRLMKSSSQQCFDAVRQGNGCRYDHEIHGVNRRLSLTRIINAPSGKSAHRRDSHRAKKTPGNDAQRPGFQVSASC
jgi:hypothetical protein